MRRYLALTKPGICAFVMITAGVGYLAAAGSVMDAGLFAGLLLSTGLLAAGAAATNQIMERRQDALMHRTRSRPLPAGTLHVRAAIPFATTLVVTGAMLAIMSLPLRAAITLFACYLSYVAYTILKLRSAACIVLGALVVA